MEVSTAEESARRGMLQDAIFPAFGNDAGNTPSAESPEEMQKNDPLGTQIWKLYSRAKTQLPNAERMENLTWRLMAMNMRRAELDRNKGYAIRSSFATRVPSPAPANTAFWRRFAPSTPSSESEMMPPPPAASARPPPRSAPSGIAQQLRKSQDQQAQVPQPCHDAMNLDDFIFPSSVGSPAGLSPELSNEDAAPFNATAPAIPIRKPHLANDHNLSLARASAPSVPPTISREDEFGYVPRHVRKTSIDERRVSCLISLPIVSRESLTNALSAPQAARRSLASGAAREQLHDAHRCPRRGRPAPVLARPAHHAAAHLPGLAGPRPLLHRYFPDARRPRHTLSWALPAEFLWLLSRRLAPHEPQCLQREHVQPATSNGVLSQLGRLLLAPQLRIPIHRVNATAHTRRQSHVLRPQRHGHPQLTRRRLVRASPTLQSRDLNATAVRVQSRRWRTRLGLQSCDEREFFATIFSLIFWPFRSCRPVSGAAQPLTFTTTA
jgi:hypothetical protein